MRITRMFSPRTRVAASLLWVCLGTVPCYGSGENEPTLKLLALAPYFEEGEGEYLVLWTRELPDIPRNQKDLDFSKLAESAASDWWGVMRGNGVFLISKRASSDIQSKVVWLAYSQVSELVKPGPIWLANLIWHPGRKEFYAILVRSVSVKAEIAIFHIDPLREIAAFPPIFNPDSGDDWLDPSQRKSTFKHIARDRDGRIICRLEWVDLLPQRDGLLVYGDTTEKGCSQIYLHLDLDSGEWTDMTMTNMTAVEEEVD